MKINFNVTSTSETFRLVIFSMFAGYSEHNTRCTLCRGMLSVPRNFCCSIISTHNDCCTSIVDYENSFKIFVKLFQKYPGRQDIVVRLGYALGNMMANSDTARTKVRMCPY